MSRQTPKSSSSDYVFQDDHWYTVTLHEWSIEAKGTPGYKDQPRKSARLECRWGLGDEADTLIFDWLNLTVTPMKDGTASKCKLLICALAGRDARRELTPWIDDENLEYGFDAAAQVVSGRIVTGTRVQLKGTVTAAKDGSGDYLKVEKFAPVTSAATPPSQPSRQLSADGRYEWDGQSWVPVQTAAPPPPPPGAPSPQQVPGPTNMLSADGRHRWDGSAWVPVEQAPAAPVQTSLI